MLAAGLVAVLGLTAVRRPPLLPSAGLPTAGRLRNVVAASVALGSDSCPADGPSTLELFRFSMPVLAALLSSEVMSVVDTAVVGSASATELAALGPATMLSDSSAYLFFWLNVAATNLFASALADDQPAAAFDVLSDALWCALVCGFFLALALHLFGPAALAAICGSAPAAIGAAQQYLQIRLLGVPALIVGTVLQAACTGSKDAVSPLVAVAGGGLLNLVLDLLLVLGPPKLGIAGAAIATLIAQLTQTLGLAIIVARKRSSFGVAAPSPLLLRGLPTARRISDFLAFAGPLFLVLLGKIACYNSMTIAATAGGVVALAAHQVVACVFFLGCKFGDAISQTAQAYLPACMRSADAATDADAAGIFGGGAGVPPPPARLLSRKLVTLAAGLGALVSAAGAAFVLCFPTVFTAERAVIGAIAAVAPLLGMGLVVHPSTMACEGLLLGARQLNFLGSAYCVNIVLFLTALWQISRRALGLRAVWTSLIAFQLVRLLQFGWRANGIGLFLPDPSRKED